MTPLSEFFLAVLYFFVRGASTLGKAMSLNVPTWRRLFPIAVYFALGWALTFSPLSFPELLGYAVMIVPALCFLVGLAVEAITWFARK